MQGQLGRHSLGDLSVKAFQLGVKGSHQLKHLLLGKECKEEVENSMDWRHEGKRVVQRSYLDSHAKIVSILNPRYLQLQPGGDLGEGKGIKATSAPTQFPGSCPSLLPCLRWV